MPAGSGLLTQLSLEAPLRLIELILQFSDLGVSLTQRHLQLLHSGQVGEVDEVAGGVGGASQVVGGSGGLLQVGEGVQGGLPGWGGRGGQFSSPRF